MATTLYDMRDKLLGAIRAKTDSPVLIDLGCGPEPREGFTGVDLHAEAPNIQKADLFTYPWPFADNSVDYFYACHFLEHVPDWDKHFEEVYRCLKVGGLYEVIGPHYLNRRYYQDPDHKQPLFQDRFMYLYRPWRKSQKIEHYGAQVNFKIAENGYAWFDVLHDDFVGQSEDALAYAKLHFFNVIEDIAAILKKLPLEAED